jgi:hypothetical protein
MAGSMSFTTVSEIHPWGVTSTDVFVIQLGNPKLGNLLLSHQEILANLPNFYPA